MKIAILGGSFDPPHLGHLFIAIQVKELLQMHQVWLMPLFEHASHAQLFHKKMGTASDRYAMTKLLENSFIRASDFEIVHNKTSYTADTLDELVKRHPSDEFFWILGSDQLENFQKYYKWQEIIKKHRIIIFPRESVLPRFEERVKQALQLKSIPGNVIVLNKKDLLLTNISSTNIRERVKNSLPIRYFVPEKVAEYIEKHKLYIESYANN